MDHTSLYLVSIALIGIVFVFPAWLAFRKEEREAREELRKAEEAGRTEPASIRPWIDPRNCMGCGACVKACPEKHVLEVIDGQARLVDGAGCVGHGACEVVCPTEAIDLVFGSEKQAVDLPQVNPRFETNVKGLFVAGELGGMGLITNAVEQGIQAVKHAARKIPSSLPEGAVGLLVVGAGPAGMAAAMEAQVRGIDFLLVDQDEFGGAIRHYPRQKLVMSRGFQLPGQERLPACTMRKEELIEYLEGIRDKVGLTVHEKERVLSVVPRSDGLFDVKTDRREVIAGRVILCLGRRGSPRTLEVEGEKTEKVAYRLIEPEHYQHQNLLVVGGGDSAVEVAMMLAEEPGNRVHLSYRKAKIGRPRPANLKALEAAVAAGKLELVLESNVTRIAPDRVFLEQKGEQIVLANDFVFVCAGGTLPTALLGGAGVSMKRHFGKRVVELAQAS